MVETLKYTNIKDDNEAISNIFNHWNFIQTSITTCLTVYPFVSWCTRACISIHLVIASTTILARIAGTFICI